MADDTPPYLAQCEDCGFLPEGKRDESGGTDGWMVYPTKCERCGGKVVLIMPDSAKPDRMAERSEDVSALTELESPSLPTDALYEEGPNYYEEEYLKRKLIKEKLNRQLTTTTDIVLSVKQRLFVKYYLELGGKFGAQTEAARKAGYKNPQNAGHEAMKNNNVLLAIQNNMAMTDELNCLTNEMVAREFAVVGFSSPLDIIAFDDEGHVVIKPSNKMSRDEAKAIASIKTNRTYDKEGQVHNETMEVKFVDRGQYLDRLAKTRGMYNDKLTIDGGMEIKTLFADISSKIEDEPIVNESATNA